MGNNHNTKHVITELIADKTFCHYVTVDSENPEAKPMTARNRRRFSSQLYSMLPEKECEIITLKAILHKSGGSLQKAADKLGIPVIALTLRLRENNIVSY